MIEHKPMTSEKLEYCNQYYQVIFIPECDRKVTENPEGYILHHNYEVRNRKYETVEWIGCDLPSALSVAEQLNSILVNKSWRETYEPDESMFVGLTTDIKGSLQ